MRGVARESGVTHTLVNAVAEIGARGVIRTGKALLGDGVPRAVEVGRAGQAFVGYVVVPRQADTVGNVARAGVGERVLWTRRVQVVEAVRSGGAYGALGVICCHTQDHARDHDKRQQPAHCRGGVFLKYKRAVFRTTFYFLAKRSSAAGGRIAEGASGISFDERKVQCQHRRAAGIHDTERLVRH